MARPKEPFSPSDFMLSVPKAAAPEQMKRKRRKRTVIADELRLTMAHFMRTNIG